MVLVSAKISLPPFSRLILIGDDTEGADLYPGLTVALDRTVGDDGGASTRKNTKGQVVDQAHALDDNTGCVVCLEQNSVIKVRHRPVPYGDTP